MAKQANTVVAGTAAKAANKRPSKGTVTKVATTPVDPMQALAATVVQAAPAATVAAPAVVALRGQAAVTAVAIKAGAVYRTKAVHNMDWWATITKATAAGPAKVADLTKAGVPSHFIGYTLRRGYLVSA